MLILAVFWIAYTIYRSVGLFINLSKHKEAELSCIIELSSDFFMGISLLLWGLALENIISDDTFVLSIPAIICLIGKIIMKKLK